MNKEEIEIMKADLFNLHNMLGKKPSISKKAIKNALKYIEKLEQKESILDKVTDKLKEDAKEEEGYIKWLDERTKEIVQPKKTIIVKSDYARSILNIIEGEKK